MNRDNYRFPLVHCTRASKERFKADLELIRVFGVSSLKIVWEIIQKF
jgi:hypothetical protein